MEKLIIIGSGPAGLTAAIYAARANLNPLLIAGWQFGGQLMLTTEVENYPGFDAGIMGGDLMQVMRKQAEKFGTKIIDKDATAVDFSDLKVKKVMIENETYEAETVIIATGANSKWLELPNEPQFRGRGISTCATCDGAFFRNKVVAVVGGGDSAMEEATFLTRFASKVYIIHRRDSFRASQIMQDRVKSNIKIEIIWNSEVVDVKGDTKLHKIVLQSTVDKSQKEMDLDGLFIAIGHEPNTKFLNGQIELDEKGYIATKDPNQTHTNIDGVFVAGDVFDLRYKQAITAAGSGCKAALDAEKYLAEMGE